MTDSLSGPERAVTLFEALGQVEQLRQENTVQAKVQYQQQREALLAQIREHFTEQLRQTNGVLTGEILQQADRFYLPGLATFLAEVLLVEPGELRRLLARKRTLECERCPHPFTVVEPRTTTGYSTSHRRLCDDCQELQTEEYQVDRERAAGDRQRAVAFDAVLMRKKNPLSLPEFTAHLEMLARYWLDQNIYQACLRDPDRGHGMGLFADILGAYPVGGGCMVCGATPVRMFWTRDNELPEDYPLAGLLDERERQHEQHHMRHPYYDDLDSELTFPSVVRPAQLAWRLEPQEFFSGIPHFPLRDMPLLLLCDDCASLAQHTHIEARQGVYFAPAAGDD